MDEAAVEKKVKRPSAIKRKASMLWTGLKMKWKIDKEERKIEQAV